MATDWESRFTEWARGPSSAEQERCANAVRQITKAIRNSAKLRNRHIKAFTHGSYRNRVNVRQDSDVDVGVMYHDGFLARYPAGKTREDFGNVPRDYRYAQFKNDLYEALVARFGTRSVTRGNKAIEVRENPYEVSADVVPLFEYRHYHNGGSYYCGVGLVPDSGPLIVNYPERLLDSWPKINQHYENGVGKNASTHRAYKGTVRILKALRAQMDDAGIAAAAEIPGFLLECLAWNPPNEHYASPAWLSRVENVLRHIWAETETDERCGAWTEVNDIKFLFHSTQQWNRAQARAFVGAAWQYVGAW